MVIIHDVISGKVPFLHLNITKKFTSAAPGFQTQVQNETDIIIPAPASKRGNPKAMFPQPSSTNLNIPENNNISIRPSNTTINTWIAVSPKKKRPKKGQKQEGVCLLVPDKFDHPQPVSKRISFGLPPNNPYLKPASNTQIHPPPCQTNILKDTATNNTYNGPVASITQSYLQLRIDRSSTSLSDINTIQMVRSVIKITLQSKAGLSVVAPSYQEVPTIFGNCKLPEKNTDMIYAQICPPR
jgi:hypothetical protein